MTRIRRKTHRGFTLVELLVVLVIISALGGALYLVLGPSDDKAKAVACYGNRVAIGVALDAYRFSTGLAAEDYTLDRFISDGYQKMITNDKAKCPSGGVYSMDPSNNKIVTCSLHGSGEPESSGGNGGSSEGSGGGGGDYITGTYTPPNYNISTYANYQNNITSPVTITQGQTFRYDGEIFYVNNGSDITLSPGMTEAEYNNLITNAYGGVIKLNTPADGNVSSWGDLAVGATIYRGDIVSVTAEGVTTYYVYRASDSTTKQQTQWWDNGPITTPGNWYTIGTATK